MRRARSGRCSKPTDGPTLSHGSRSFRELLSTEILFDSLSVDARRRPRRSWGRSAPCTKPAMLTGRSSSRQAIEKIKGREEWTAVPESMREPVLGPLSVPLLRRAGPSRWLGLACKTCRATSARWNRTWRRWAGCSPRSSPRSRSSSRRPRSRWSGCGSLTSSPERGERGAGQAGGARLQDHLLKLLDEGVKIVVE